jgi:hypothetical protein
MRAYEHHTGWPWDVFGPLLLIGLPIIAVACLALYAQIYWPYGEPKRNAGKDKEDQDGAGIAMREGDEPAEQPSTEMTSSGILRVEDGLPDPDVITEVPPAWVV